MSNRVETSGNSWLEEFMAMEKLAASSGPTQSTGQGYSIDYEKGTCTSYGHAGDRGTTRKLTDEEAKSWGAGAYYQGPSSSAKITNERGG
ncbi:MAG: hypothetical protein JNK65_09405 [Deltaproteobacteria bacterium]|nr:hypothetical protein [Deltaproteobacteria bacterium]